MLTNPTADLLPEIDEIQKVSKLIAFKVAKAAMDAGVAPIISDEQLQHAIEKTSGSQSIVTINVLPSKAENEIEQKGA
jgi:malic enzyme